MNATEWIAKRRELIEAATEGPWVAEYGGAEGDCVIPHDAESTREAVAVTRLYRSGADAEFIAVARTSLPAALDALDAALALAKGHRDFVTKRGRDDCICTICDMCRAIETALRGASVP